MFFLQVLGDGHGVHNVGAVWELDRWGGVLGHAGRRVIGLDANGGEFGFEVWVLDPFGGVGYAFEVKVESSCQVSVKTERNSQVSRMTFPWVERPGLAW